ncbi:MAG: hypothetical protein ACLPH3_21690 [Terracidiphilus sp.]
MDDAENIFFPTAGSGGVDALGSLREASLSGPGINDAAECVSVLAINSSNSIITDALRDLL